MSIEHMRTADTLKRNIEMSFAVECGASLQVVAATYKVRPSSVRSSVNRTRSHILKFITKFPNELDGKNAKRNAYKAFAEHVGASVSLLRKTDKIGAQRDLF
jgi:hypothetical protein